MRKIAKPVLKYTLKESAGKDDDKVDSDALRELNQMLKGTRDKAEIAHLREAISDCHSKGMKERKRELNRRRVVGVTCHSTSRPVMEKQKFGFLILDEVG